MGELLGKSKDLKEFNSYWVIKADNILGSPRFITLQKVAQEAQSILVTKALELDSVRTDMLLKGAY